jgi:DNA-binding FadR family transcriptional regulator
LILFLTGNADNGSFAVAEKTVCDRCGFDKSTYRRARQALVAKGWIEHEKGKITVLYDAIYGSTSELNFED